MPENLKGIMPAIASPCDQNDVFLEDEFAALADHLYEQGVHGLYVCGGTGDGYNMRLEERKRAAEIAIEVSRKHKGKVIVQLGTSNTRDSVELAEHAAQAGAAAVSSIPPAGRDHAQLISYYTDIARASRLPLLVYHIPILSGHVLTVDQMLALLDIDHVVGFKFSDWNLFFMKRVLIRRPDVTIFSGNDEILFPCLLYGGHGGIGMNYNLFPKLFLGIYQAARERDIKRGMDLQNRFLAYADVFWRYGGILANFEVLMREQGLASYCWRRPRPVMDEETTGRFLDEVRPKLAQIEEALQ